MDSDEPRNGEPGVNRVAEGLRRLGDLSPRTSTAPHNNGSDDTGHKGAGQDSDLR
jgi:hypothetical protein